MATVKVGTASARPGERTYGTISAGALAIGAPIEVPVALVHGASPGPWLFAGAAVHGDEVNSIDVLRRVIPAIDPEELRGVVAAVAVVNPLAFEHRNRAAPQDSEDMNRVWPGKPDGKLAERLAHAIYIQAVSPADAVVDLHTGATRMAVHTVYAEGDSASRDLALAFGTELLLEERRDEQWQHARFNGKLRCVVGSHGIPAITPELGSNRTFQEVPIQAGVDGLRGVLDHLGMLKGHRPRPNRRITLSGSHLDSITASGAGLFVAEVEPGSRLRAGQRLGYLYRPTDFTTVEEFVAPTDTLVLALVDNPVVDTGGYIATLTHVRSVD